MLHLTKKKIVMHLISLRQAVDVALTEKKLFQHLKLKTVIFRTVTDVNGNGNFFFSRLSNEAAEISYLHQVQKWQILVTACLLAGRRENYTAQFRKTPKTVGFENLY